MITEFEALTVASTIIVYGFLEWIYIFFGSREIVKNVLFLSNSGISVVMPA